METGAPLDVTVTREGEIDPVVLTANGIEETWAISQSDSLSLEAWTDDLLRAGFLPKDNPGYLWGKWLFFDHPDLGPWGGRDRRRRARPPHRDDGGRGPDVRFHLGGAAHADGVRDRRRRAGGVADRPGDRGLRPGGGAALGLPAAAGRDGRAPGDLRPRRRRRRRRPPGGRGGRPGVAGQRRPLGRHPAPDRRRPHPRGPGRLGGDVVGGSYAGSLRPIVNELLAVPGDDAFRRSDALLLEDPDSVERTRLRQGSKVYPGLLERSSLRTAAERDLRLLANAGEVYTIDLDNSRGAWRKFREGDTISLVLPQINAEVDYRVMIRSWSSEEEPLRLSGYAEVRP